MGINGCKPPLLCRANRGLTQSGEKLTSSGAGLPAPMRHLGSPGPARILEGAKVLVCKPIMHCKGDATTIGPATNTVVTEEDRLVRFVAAVADDDRHDLALATFRVGFEPDTTQLREQDRASQDGCRVHVNGLGHNDHDYGIVYPSRVNTIVRRTRGEHREGRLTDDVQGSPQPGTDEFRLHRGDVQTKNKTECQIGHSSTRGNPSWVCQRPTTHEPATTSAQTSWPLHLRGGRRHPSGTSLMHGQYFQEEEQP